MKKRAFTLIELLVVISIIGLLSSVVLASLNGARVKARDAKRIVDMTQIRIALELYYDKYGFYPQSSCGWDCNGYRLSFDSTSWQALQADLAEFLPQLPVDSLNSGCPPWSGGCYSYAYGNVGRITQRLQYDLTAQLETPNHPQSCGVRGYRFYFDNQGWCPASGGGYSSQLIEVSHL